MRHKYIPTQYLSVPCAGGEVEELYVLPEMFKNPVAKFATATFEPYLGDGLLSSVS